MVHVHNNIERHRPRDQEHPRHPPEPARPPQVARREAHRPLHAEDVRDQRRHHAEESEQAPEVHLHVAVALQPIVLADGRRADVEEKVQPQVPLAHLLAVDVPHLAALRVTTLVLQEAPVPRVIVPEVPLVRAEPALGESHAERQSHHEGSHEHLPLGTLAFRAVATHGVGAVGGSCMFTGFL